METSSKTEIWKAPENANGPLTADRVYAMVGRTLFDLHQLKALLKIGAGVLQESAAFSEGEIDATEAIWAMRRHTLGKVIFEIRKVVHVEPGLTTVVTRLIRRRNALAHKLSAHTPFHPKNHRWLLNVPRFLWALQSDLYAVHYVFARYLEALLLEHSDHPDFPVIARELSAYMRFKS